MKLSPALLARCQTHGNAHGAVGMGQKQAGANRREDVLARRFTVSIAGLVVKSEANLREHWAVRKKRRDKQRLAVAWMLRGMPYLPWRRAVVTMTRLGKRLLDDDNLAGGFKAIRDAIAEWFGVDDGPAGPIEWRVRQEKSSEYGVRIEIEQGKDGAK